MDSKGLSQAELARRAGMSQGGLNKVLAGGDPSLSTVIALANAADVAPEWLIAGRGEFQPATPVDFALIPYLDVRASAGPGALAPEVDGPPERFLAFREDWLRRIGVSPRHAEVLIAVGDSMEPTIRDGDVLLVDRSIDRIVNEGLYIVIYQGMVLLKRVQLARSGMLVLKSDNDRYEPEIVPASERENVAVAGRVRWFGRTI